MPTSETSALATSRCRETPKMYDLFITHAWRFHDSWNRLVDLLDCAQQLQWRNFSLPWYDPAMSPRSKLGGKTLRGILETQIIPAEAVILLSQLYLETSNHKWLDMELEMARQHGKPVVALPAAETGELVEPAGQVADAVAAWDVASLLAAVDELTKRSGTPRSD